MNTIQTQWVKPSVGGQGTMKKGDTPIVEDDVVDTLLPIIPDRMRECASPPDSYSLADHKQFIDTFLRTIKGWRPLRLAQ